MPSSRKTSEYGRTLRDQPLHLFLLFRRHTVVLSIGVDPDERAARRDAEAMIQSFTPFVP